MSGNLDLFDEYSTYEGLDIVMVGNGDNLSIKHIGKVNLYTSSGTVTLSNVLHVPSLQQNLLSISQFTTDHNC